MTQYPMAALGDLCNVSIGRTPRRNEPRYWGGPYPWATVRDLNGEILMSTQQGITDAAIKGVMPQPVKPNTLLFSFKLSIGKVAFAGCTMYHNEAIAALPVRNPNILDREFLFHVLKAMTHDEGANHAVLGKVLNKRKVEELEIPIPPLDEQRRIAGILNRAAKVERMRTLAEERLREFAPALFVKVFGSGSINRDGWAIATIKELVERKNGAIRTGPFGSQLKHSEFVDGGIPVLGIDNVVANCFRWTKPRCLPLEKFAKFVRYRVYPEDVLITIMGTTGRVCVAPENLPECMSTKHLCVLTLNRSLVEPIYVWGALLFDENVRSQTRTFAQGQIMEGWNSKIVKNLCLRIPPLALQRYYAEIVEAARTTAAVAESGSRIASELSAALMSRLLKAAA